MPRCVLLLDLVAALQAVENGLLEEPDQHPIISCLRIPREDALADPEIVLKREERDIGGPLRMQTVMKVQVAIMRAEQSGHAVWMGGGIDETSFRACVNAILRCYWLPEIPPDMPLSAGREIKRHIEETGNKHIDKVLVLSSL